MPAVGGNLRDEDGKQSGDDRLDQLGGEKVTVLLRLWKDEETGTVSFDPANMLPGGYSFTIEVQAAKGDSKDKIQINAEP